MHAALNLSMQRKDDTEVQVRRPLRAPAVLPRPQLKQVQILHRVPLNAWIRDDSFRANTLLDGLASYLRNKDPV